MATDGREKESLQSVVLKCFSTIFSGDQQQRKGAEEELKALEVTEGIQQLNRTLFKVDPPHFTRFWSSIGRDYPDTRRSCSL